MSPCSIHDCGPIVATCCPHARLVPISHDPASIHVPASLPPFKRLAYSSDNGSHFLLFSTGNIRSLLPTLRSSSTHHPSSSHSVHPSMSWPEPSSSIMLNDDRQDLKVTLHLYVPVDQEAAQTASIVQRACIHARKEIGISASDMSVLHFSLNSSSVYCIRCGANTKCSTTLRKTETYLAKFITMWRSLEYCHSQQHTFALGLCLDSFSPECDSDNDINSLDFLKQAWDSMVVKPHQVFIPRTYKHLHALKEFIDNVNSRDGLAIKISITSQTQDKTASLLLHAPSLSAPSSPCASPTSSSDSLLQNDQYFETQFMIRYDVLSNRTSVIVDSGYLIEAQVKSM